MTYHEYQALKQAKRTPVPTTYQQMLAIYRARRVRSAADAKLGLRQALRGVLA